MKTFILSLILALAIALALGGFLKSASAQIPAQNHLWAKIFKSEEFRPEQFAPGADLTPGFDWSAAVETATKAAVEQGGNTVKFTCGKTYRVNSPVKLQARAHQFIAHSFKWQGCGSDYEFQSGNPTIEYTGGGDESAFDFRTSYGVRIEGMRIRATNPSFTGRLVDKRHSTIAEGGTGGDASYFAIRDSTLTGTESANQMILLDLGGAIIGEVSKTHFFDGRVGILGASDVRDGKSNHYAYVFQITGNTFNRVDAAIRNVSSNWHITTNAFEPNRFHKVIAVDNDCGLNCSFAAGVVYATNYHGDGAAQVEPMARFVNAYGLNVFGNKFYVEGGTARTAIELDGCEGVNVFGNFGQMFEAFVETKGATSWGVKIEFNKVNVKEHLRETAVCAGCNIVEPSKAGTAPRMSKISALLASDYAADGSVYDLAIGWKANEHHYNSGGVFSSMDGSYGMLGGAVGIFAGKNHDAPVFFATDNKVRAQINGAGFRSNVPVIVPDAAYSPEAWNASGEVPTKNAVRDELERLAKEIEKLKKDLKAVGVTASPAKPFENK